MTKLREVNPFELRKFLSKKCNKKGEKLMADSKNGLSFIVKIIEELNILYEIKKFEDFCEITFHNFLNQTKGIFDLQNCKINEELKKKLKEEHPFIENSIEASFIKSTNSKTTAVLLILKL